MPTACMALPVRLQPAFDGSISWHLLTATPDAHTIHSTSLKSRATSSASILLVQKANCPLPAHGRLGGT